MVNRDPNIYKKQYKDIDTLKTTRFKKKDTMQTVTIRRPQWLYYYQGKQTSKKNALLQEIKKATIMIKGSINQDNNHEDGCDQ